MSAVRQGHCAVSRGSKHLVDEQSGDSSSFTGMKFILTDRAYKVYEHVFKDGTVCKEEWMFTLYNHCSTTAQRQPKKKLCMIPMGSDVKKR